MTIIRLSSYIPKNDVKINVKYMIKLMYDIFDDYINDIVNEKDILLINNLYNKFKKNVKNRYFWYRVSSNKFCCYEYTDRNNEKLAYICNKRIDIKYDEKDENRYFCAEHNRNHRRNNAKSIKIDNENRCSAIKKNYEQCKYSAKIDGICTEHYKSKYNVNNIKNVYNIIEEIKVLNNIEYLSKIENRYINKLCLNQDNESVFICNNILQNNDNYCHDVKDSINSSIVLEINNNIDKLIKNSNKRKYNDHYRFIPNKKRRHIKFIKKSSIKKDFDFDFNFKIPNFYTNYINKIGKEEINKKILNTILDEIINIRNYIYENHINIDNIFFNEILKIFTKIIDKIDLLYINTGLS